jgi:hypothetical protein
MVFISHSAEDGASYSSLCLALDGAGVHRWDVSKLGAGKPLAQELRAAIDQCDVCVFLATPHSVKSAWCLAELGAFWGAGKPVIVYLCDRTIDESQLPPQFRGILWTADAKQLLASIRETDVSPVRRIAGGYAAAIGSTMVRITIGRIEECDGNDPTRLVALPANEFFDDECIHDPQSVLGAFMQRHFGGDVAAIQSIVRTTLENVPTAEVWKTPGEHARSYGVGRCVFLDRPLGTGFRIAMVSVTTQRADVGLRADVLSVFASVFALQRTMANHRLTRLRVPTLGSGHGGMKPEVSLACILIAIGELSRRETNKIREVDLVVFDGNRVAESTVRRVLEFANRFSAS